MRIGGVPTLDWVAELDHVASLENNTDLPPLRRLSGRIRPRRPDALEKLIESEQTLPLGVGIDDRLVATTRSTKPRDGDEYLEFSVLLPYAAVEEGGHQVVLYLLAFDETRALPPIPIPRAFEKAMTIEGIEAAPAGIARAIRFQGVDAPVEIFGWVPEHDESGVDIVSVAVLRRDIRLTKAQWLDDEKELGYRYRFDGAPENARLFRAVVPTDEDLRVVASNRDGRVLELPVVVASESVFRVTGPFSLRFDPRRPPAAYQNF